MEMDVNRQAQHNANLMTISARCCPTNNNAATDTTEAAATTTTTTTTATATSSSSSPSSYGCCGILSRLFCVSRHKATRLVAGTECSQTETLFMQRKTLTTQPAAAASQRRRRTPQEIYFESRGKSCKKLLKFNGNSNKILLYPEEGWARTASSSYWTITPCWWQPNRCRIVECSGTQRQATRARMLPMEQQGSLLIAGHFRRPPITATGGATTPATATPQGFRDGGDGDGARGAAGNESGSCSSRAQSKSKSQMAYNDEFKLYLTSNISMEDYNMGYCLTGFVERRCQQTNTFQMTHFAVIKRQWPPPSNLSNS